MFIFASIARHRGAINHTCTIALRATLSFEISNSKKEHDANRTYGACVLFKFQIRNTPYGVARCGPIIGELVIILQLKESQKEQANIISRNAFAFNCTFYFNLYDINSNDFDIKI